MKSCISYIGKKNDLSSSGLIVDNGSDHTNINPFYSIYLKEMIQQLLRQRYKKIKKNQGPICTLLNRNDVHISN